MQYRLYDTKEKCWVKDEFCVSYRGDIFLSKKGLFGREKLELAPESRYTCHRDIGVEDANGNLIFEGDIIRNTANHKKSGVVAYAPDDAAYCIFDDVESVYYGIDKDSRCMMEIIGNVFDGRMVEEDDEESEEDVVEAEVVEAEAEPIDEEEGDNVTDLQQRLRDEQQQYA